MKQYIDLIRDITLFKSLSEDEIISRLKDGSFKVVSYMKDNVLHFDGERCMNFELILSGKISINHIDESGNLLNIADFFSGDILGGNLLFSKNPQYPYTVSAKKQSIILVINKDVLLKMLSNNLAFLKIYLEHISDNATALGGKLKYYANKSIREKINSYIEHESKRQNSNHIILPITKTTLAEKIGVQRTSLSRELAKMRDDGLISFDAKSITILKL